ncbi:hypothetical protein COCC4DRAFT_148871 [Bipolaris maydis ATCC 48331]|uniref:ferric-chelate reductase (NADPH) n=2 Tax=Cochliobolus heterostrophus TaxID=5016 RepID=N4WL76_COCH4|nr:uncharacterized protein COCC4DRAFT_148871 [Bipolaris maydis ATCC 48331]ENI01104.1 hypothetical protein COCC4DRAFT_148871 [Bipolaris maydis ATCC 48331]
MQISLVYAVALASAFGLLLIWKALRFLKTPARRRLCSLLRKRLIYTTFYRRRIGSDNVSILTFLKILIYFVANIAACALDVGNREELANRCGSLFIINLVPLLLGGRTSLLGDRLIRLHPSQSSLIHRWVGRVCITEGLIHGILHAMLDPRLTIVQSLLLSLATALMVFSFIYVRRYMFELFIKTHLLFALMFVGVLWFHIPFRNRRALVCLSLTSAVWLVQKILWLIRVGNQNSGRKAANEVTITAFMSKSGVPDAASVTVPLKKNWLIRPGQYIYLTLPGVSRHCAGFIQAHPYSIAWVDGSEIILIVQRFAGFSANLHHANTHTNFEFSRIVDGPYGSPHHLNSYDKVLFLASGIGIVAHLLAIRDLLVAHENQSARVRRITLVWFLETTNQEQWVKSILQRLMENDQRHIFTLAIYIPSEDVVQDHTSLGMYERCFRTDQALDLGWFISKENLAEAGSMAALVCGTAHFEEAVRHGVRRCEQDIHLLHCGFQPEDTKVSAMARSRFS